MVEFALGKRILALFRQMVNLMVKPALAAIPAMILLSIIYALFAAMGLGFLLRH